MRIAVLAGMIVALAGCAYSVATPVPQTEGVFAAQRGTALPPPTGASGAAPPEGRAAGGIDFGNWRQADPASYQPAFQSQIRERLAGKTSAQMRADLAANGFTCSGEGVDCRIEIMERQCAFDWYVVVGNEPEPVAGFDVMCLGAN